MQKDLQNYKVGAVTSCNAYKYGSNPSYPFILGHL